MVETKLGDSRLLLLISHIQVHQEPGGGAVAPLVLVQVQAQLAARGEGEPLVGGVAHHGLQR